MTILAEIFIKDLDSRTDSKTKVEILTSTVNISNLLFQLPKDIFDQINRIMVIPQGTFVDQNFYMEIFQNFHVNVSYYFQSDIEYTSEFYDKFVHPADFESIKIEVLERVERLIHRIQLVESIDKLDNEQTFLCYLPLIKNSEHSFLNLSNITLIEDFEKAEMWLPKRFYDIPKTKYIQTKNYLSKYSNNTPGNTWEEYKYKHFKFLRHFTTEYNEELYKITHSNYSKQKVHFNGSDYFIAKKSTMYFMKYDEFLKIDLRRGIRDVNRDWKRFMFAYIDYLNDDELNSLRKIVKPIELEREKIAIHGLKNDLDFHLGTYWSMTMPDSKDIQNLITKLFLAMLNDEGKLKGNIRDLFKIIQENGFQVLLKDVKDLTDLHEFISSISMVSVEDLLFHPAFWVNLQEEIGQMNLKNNQEPSEHTEKQIDKWEFTFTGEYWLVKKNGDLIIHTDNNYITYLVMIIRYQEIFKKKIHGVVLLRAVSKFHESVNPKIGKKKPRQGSKDRITNTNLMGSWTNRKSFMNNKLKIEELKKEIIKQFLKDHFDEEYPHVMLKNKHLIKIEIDSETKKIINQHYFDDLRESSEAYK